MICTASQRNKFKKSNIFGKVPRKTPKRKPFKTQNNRTNCQYPTSSASQRNKSFVIWKIKICFEHNTLDIWQRKGGNNFKQQQQQWRKKWEKKNKRINSLNEWIEAHNILFIQWSILAVCVFVWRVEKWEKFLHIYTNKMPFF